MAVRVNNKGQVTIPQPIRAHLGIGPGSHVDFRLTTSGNIVIEKTDDLRPSCFARARGSAGPGMTTDELMALFRGMPE